MTLEFNIDLHSSLGRTHLSPDAGENERAQRAAETAKHRQERVTKCMERDGAWLSTLTAAALNLYVLI